MDSQQTLKQMIEQYNSELLRAYEKRGGEPAAEETRPAVAVAGPEPVSAPEEAAPVSEEMPVLEPEPETTFESEGVPTFAADEFVFEEAFFPEEEEGFRVENFEVYDTPPAAQTYADTAAEPRALHFKKSGGTGEQIFDFLDETDEEAPVSEEDDMTVPDTAGVGHIRVWVTDGDALPVPAAAVTVSSATPGGEVIQYAAMTNEDGLTPLFPLATLPSGEEGAENATVYHVSVDAPGYYRLVQRDLPVYPGTPTVHPAEMVKVLLRQ